MISMPAFVDAAARHLAERPPVRVLYTDLDGTLLGPGGALLRAPDGQPSARAAQALAEAAAEGLTVVPVSGRQRRQLEQDARLMGLGDAIAEAGTAVVTDGVLRYTWGQCPPGLAETPHDALRRAGALEALLTRFDGDVRPYEPWWRGREGTILLHGVLDVEVANTALAEAGVGWAEVIDNGATEGWPGREVRAYHVLPRGVGKARAVAEDLARRGLDADAAAAIGDSPEDARMAQVVGTYFTVANGGVDGAGLVTPSAMGHGFAEAVTVLLAHREEAS
ncbi:MAG: HAD-IIB family hydrolase [Egibacteraceae bacterium]